MRSCTDFCAPEPRATIVITAPTPMMMPSMVRSERSLLTRSASRATRMISPRSMGLCGGERHVETADVALAAGRQRKQELRAPPAIDPIPAVPAGAASLHDIGRLRVHPIRQGVIKVELRGEREPRPGRGG